MVDSLQNAMEDAVARQRFYAEAEEALQSTLRSNKVYRGAEVKAQIIFEAFEVLAHSPEIGRKVRGGNRELVISRGSSGYLALYRCLQTQDTVLVLAIRHQREVGYPGT